MPPFLQFRLWLRESPATERVLAAIAAVVALGLIVLALVPVTNDDSTTELAVDSHGLSATSTTLATTDVMTDTSTPIAVGGASRAPATRGVTGGTNDATTAAACHGIAASGPGVTATQVSIDVSTISLAGPVGNSTFGIRPDLHDIATALADEINKTGGVACGRKLAIKIYDVNPLDTNDAQAKCLDMVADKPYLVLDFGGYLGQATRACFVQNKLPIISSVAIDSAEQKSAFPYVVSPRNLAEDQVRQSILGLAERGFFKAPKFKKLGLFEDSCLPAVNKEIDARLAQVGVKPNQVSKFTLDCATAAAPNQTAQAVLQHKGDNVTHVFLATANANSENYSRIAANQAFRPVYGIGDYGEGVTPSGASNWDASFDGAMGITSTHTGETFSGMTNAKVKACDQIMKRHGVNGFTSEAKDLALLAFCDLYDFFRATINNAGSNPVRTGFGPAISGIGEFVTAYAGDGNFTTPGKVNGNDFQRAIQFHTDCGCWKVLDAFRPAYAA